jgi:hypothetical protein
MTSQTKFCNTLVSCEKNHKLEKIRTITILEQGKEKGVVQCP